MLHVAGQTDATAGFAHNATVPPSLSASSKQSMRSCFPLHCRVVVVAVVVVLVVDVVRVVVVVLVVWVVVDAVVVVDVVSLGSHVPHIAGHILLANERHTVTL